VAEKLQAEKSKNEALQPDPSGFNMPTMNAKDSSTSRGTFGYHAKWDDLQIGLITCSALTDK